MRRTRIFITIKIVLNISICNFCLEKFSVRVLGTGIGCIFSIVSAPGAELFLRFLENVILKLYLKLRCLNFIEFAIFYGVM